jgi:hypothetical protein
MMEIQRGHPMTHDLPPMDDRLALCNAKARYCRTLDTKDWAGYADLLTEDYVLDVSEGSQVPVIKGRDAAVKQVQSSILNGDHGSPSALSGDRGDRQ